MGPSFELRTTFRLTQVPNKLIPKFEEVLTKNFSASLGKSTFFGNIVMTRKRQKYPSKAV